MEPLLIPRVFCMRSLRELMEVPGTTTDMQLFILAARHQNMPECDAAAIGVDYLKYRETGYPPSYIEGAFNDLVKAKSVK